VHPTAARWLRILAGALAANLLGWLMTALYALLFAVAAKPEAQYSQLIFASVYPNLLLVPMAMGVIAAYVWRPLELRIWAYLLCALLTVVICVAGAWIVLREGVVCLLIVSPILWVAMFGGALIGRVLFRKLENKLQVAILPLIILAVLAEGRNAREESGVVSDQVTIAAPAAEVWKHVVAFPRITSEPDYWLNRVGLPSAAETTCEGEFVGARRECIFSNGLVFKERIAELEPQRLLTFDVTEQPRDPELLGHVTLHRGQFDLQSNGDGTTTLIGRSWYTLHVRPTWYFDWWTRDITHEVHLRVMSHIKDLSEHPL